MYDNSTAVYRPDIQAFHQQAKNADKYFVAEKLLPVQNVPKRAGQYPRIKIASGSLMRKDMSKRNATGTYNELTRKHEWDNYRLTDRGLEERIDDDKADEMEDFFDLETTTSALLVRNLKIDLESNTKDALFDTSVFDYATAKVNYTETLRTTCDFSYDMNYAINQLILNGADVNTLVLSNVLWQYIRRTKMLQDYLFGSEPTKKKIIRAKDVSEAFSEESGRAIEVVIASAGYDSSNRASDTPTLSPIWPATHIWLGDVKGGDFSAGGAGRMLSWTKAIKSGLFTTETWREEKRRGDMIRVRSYADAKIVDETAGFLIVTNYSAN